MIRSVGRNSVLLSRQGVGYAISYRQRISSQLVIAELRRPIVQSCAAIRVHFAAYGMRGNAPIHVLAAVGVGVGVAAAAATERRYEGPCRGYTTTKVIMIKGASMNAVIVRFNEQSDIQSNPIRSVVLKVV